MIILPSNNDYINQSGRSKLFFLILACVILNEQWFLQWYPLNLSLSKPFSKHKYPTKSSGHHKLIATMSVDCKSCSLTIRPRQDSVLCYCCDTFFHRTCTRITQKDYREQKALTPRVQFLCSTCRQLVQQPAAQNQLHPTQRIQNAVLTSHRLTSPDSLLASQQKLQKCEQFNNLYLKLQIWNRCS